MLTTLLAQGIGCGDGLGPIARAFCGIRAGDVTKVGTSLNSVISAILGFLTVLAALWFLIQFILAGYSWISSGGDKNAATAAWQKITNSIIGLIIVVAAWIIVAVLGELLGIQILNPGAILQKIQIK